MHPHLLPWTNHAQRMLIIPRCAVQALFDAILAGLLARVRDHNGRVQEAACSGLAEVLEHAGHCTQGAILVPRFQVRDFGLFISLDYMFVWSMCTAA
jgi:hypothetical protein